TLSAAACIHGRKQPHVVGGRGVFEIRCPDVQPPWDTWAVSVQPPTVKCNDEFDEAICRAIRYLAKHAPTVVNLENSQRDIEAVAPAEKLLRAAGILVENMAAT